MNSTNSPTLTSEPINTVLRIILNGGSLKEATETAGITHQIFHKMLSSDKESAAAYARAVEIKGDILADQVIQLADGSGDPAKVRNQIQARQWLAAKLNKKYSERIDLNVQQTIDIGSTLAEARARLIPIRDQSNIVDVEPFDSIDFASKGERDKQSIALGAAPDIFT